MQLNTVHLIPITSWGSEVWKNQEKETNQEITEAIPRISIQKAEDR